MLALKAYLDKMKKIQIDFLEYLNNEEDDNDYKYQKFIEILEDSQIRDCCHELKSFLHLLINIFNNHHRHSNFFHYFEEIILYLLDDIKKYYSNSEIYTIFKSNKRMLLFLINTKILVIDEYMFNQMKRDNYDYLYYFFPEIKKFLDPFEVSKFPTEISSDFYDKRQIGENDFHICELIRNDSAEEFIIYVNSQKIPLSSTTINNSIFETNQFLIDKKPTLIEYSAFYGSIQIFQYLLFNNADLSPFLWNYAVHSKSGEIIHLLEENHAEPLHEDFNECMLESIKCHHIDISEYIRINLLSKNNIQTIDQSMCSLKYYNFAFIFKEFINNTIFGDLIRYDYYIIVKILMRYDNIKIDCRIQYGNEILFSNFNKIKIILFNWIRFSFL